MQLLNNPIYRVFGALVLAYGVISLLYCAYRVVTAQHKITKLHYASLVIASLYPIGLGCKVMVLGPEFIRFHLSDIGFPVALGMLLNIPFAAALARSCRNRGMSTFDQAKAVAFGKSMPLIYALILSYGYEAFNGFMYRQRPGTQPTLVGTFDWWDMAMYTLGAVAALYLYKKHRVLYSRDLDEAENQYMHELAAHKAAIKAGNKAEIKQRRKARKPRSATNRKGGRR